MTDFRSLILFLLLLVVATTTAQEQGTETENSNSIYTTEATELLNLGLNISTVPDDISCPGLCPGFQTDLGGNIFVNGQEVAKFTCGAINIILQGGQVGGEATAATDPICDEIFSNMESLLGVDLTSFCDCPHDGDVNEEEMKPDISVVVDSQITSSSSSCNICPNNVDFEPPPVQAAVVVRGNQGDGCDLDSRCPCLNVKWQSQFLLGEDYCLDLQRQAEEMGCCTEPWPTPPTTSFEAENGDKEDVDNTDNNEGGSTQTTSTTNTGTTSGSKIFTHSCGVVTFISTIVLIVAML